MNSIICDHIVYFNIDNLYLPEEVIVQPTYLNLLYVLESKEQDLEKLLSKFLSRVESHQLEKDSILYFEPFFNLLNLPQVVKEELKLVGQRFDKGYKYSIVSMVEDIKEKGSELTYTDKFPILLSKLRLGMVFNESTFEYTLKLILQKSKGKKDDIKDHLGSFLKSLCFQYKSHFLEIKEDIEFNDKCNIDLFASVFSEYLMEDEIEVDKKLLERLFHLCYVDETRKFVSTDKNMLRLIKKSRCHKKYLYLFSTSKLKSYVLNEILLKKLGLIVGFDAKKRSLLNPIGLSII